MVSTPPREDLPDGRLWGRTLSPTEEQRLLSNHFLQSPIDRHTHPVASRGDTSTPWPPPPQPTRRPAAVTVCERARHWLVAYGCVHIWIHCMCLQYLMILNFSYWMQWNFIFNPHVFPRRFYCSLLRWHNAFFVNSTVQWSLWCNETSKLLLLSYISIILQLTVYIDPHVPLLAKWLIPWPGVKLSL